MENLIKDKINENEKQLRKNFKNNTYNISYFCIEGDITSEYNTELLNNLLHQYFNSDLSRKFNNISINLSINCIVINFSKRYLYFYLDNMGKLNLISENYFIEKIKNF